MKNSCIRQRANARLAILHEDYLELCDGNMLAAMLLAILIYWTDIKINKKESTLWVWKSHVDFQEDLMFDKPGMKPPHRTTIKTALDLLTTKKFLYWRKNPKMPLDQTRQYLIDQKAIQSAIDALPSIVGKATLESRNSDNATSENQQSMSENRQCNVEIPTSNTNDYSTVITDPVITGKEEGTGALAQPTRDHIHLADMEEDVREIAISVALFEQERADTDHIHVGSLDGACCQQCEKAVLRKITNHRLKAIAKGQTDAAPHSQHDHDGDWLQHDSDSGAPVATRLVQRPEVARENARHGAADAQRADKAQTLRVELTPPVATQKRLSLKDETPRPSAKQQLESEIAHYYDILQAELPGVVFSASQRKARNNLATIQAMISDKLADETLCKALKKLSSWERQNFNLKRFYEEWMPAKLATMPAVTNGKPGRGKPVPVEDESDPYSFASILKRQAEQEAATA